MFTMLVRSACYLPAQNAVLVDGPADGRLQEGGRLEVEGLPAPALTVVGRGVAEPLRLRLGTRSLLLAAGSYPPEGLVGKKLVQR